MDYGGWTSVSAERSLESLCGAFELSVSETWAVGPGQFVTRPIRAGQPCQLLFDGKPVLTGYVDDVEYSYDKRSHEVTVRGRDKTADLIDCSAGSFAGSEGDGGQWLSQTLLQVASSLCAAFQIQATSDVEQGAPVETCSIQPSETAFECIEKFARFKAMLLTTDPDGNLLITRASAEQVPTVLEHGKNILEVHATYSMRRRGNVYRVIAEGIDDDDGAVALDPGVPRHRPITVVAEDLVEPPNGKQRAQWEANVRAARGTQIEVTVQGWTHPDGLWLPNRRVLVRIPWLGLDGEALLLSGVRWMADDKGTRARLTLTRPEAFSLLPVRSNDLFEAATP
jgi:prophage tail gpP-like protein